ncbi:AMP-binding protein [Egicoccus sp. AB-alg2]|uniref:AMP-binding protein n=1 Tax=Egicoccus sp. AB-alg2 TaxID=3242693 RepID=UPI00359D6DFD
MTAPAANRVPLSPLGFLDRNADVFPDRTGFVRSDRTEVSWATMRDRAVRLAAALRASGIGRGDTVAVLAPNDLPLLEAHYGVPASGAALVALNVRLAAPEYAGILGHAGCRVLVVDASLVPALGDLGGLPDTLERLVVIGDPGTSAAPAGDYESWLADAPLPAAVRLGLPDDEDQPIAINYTSGTTGTPKGAVYTHRGAYLNATGQALQFGLSPQAVYLWTLPMFHCNGWCFTWAVTAASATHVGTLRFDAAEALDVIEQRGVTHLCGAPVVLNALADAAGDRRFAQPVHAATGGAPPSPSVLERLGDLGVEVLHLYGLTETYGPSLICERQPGWERLGRDDLAAKLARQGVRTVNVHDVRVVDADLRHVPADATTIGEIVVRSNTVMAGYLGDEAATERAFSGGWFHTGDLAVVHPDGYLEIRDRAKDLIVSGGENISSIEVENAIASHPAVRAVAVVGAPDERWGEVPVAHVEVRDGATLTGVEVVAHVRRQLAGFKVPKRVVFGPLPVTSTGKIRKTELRART